MKTELLLSKLARVTEKYPSPDVQCRIVLSEHVKEAEICLGKYGDNVIQINPAFVDKQSEKSLGFIIGHEKAHVLHKETYSWPYIVACDDFKTISRAPSLLTLALAFLAYKFPRQASSWSKPSAHPVFLTARYLMRKSEARADKTGIMGSLELCEGAIQSYSELAQDSKALSWLERMQRTHPTHEARVQELYAVQADILCSNGCLKDNADVEKTEVRNVKR
ncbi:MAG: M48 family metalloprotease [Gammaproteobacteria bacterium]